MATVSGVATSFNLPQYFGSLFQKSERPNAFLKLVGGLTGNIRLVGAKQFPMGVDYTLPAASQPSILEGADPVLTEQDLGSQASNVVQVFQEGFGLNYSRMGAQGAVSGLAITPEASGGDELILPGTMEFQQAMALARIARQANYSFLRGTYNLPADNTTARTTRGVVTAISTHSAAIGGALTKANLETNLQSWMADGMFQRGDELYCLGNDVAINELIGAYESMTQLPIDRNVVGVDVRTIITKWAKLNVVWEPDMPSGDLLVCQPQFCRVVSMPIPGKGVLFVEPVAQTGAAEKMQAYGELGVDYRSEYFHGLLTGIV